jgi:hypothetical protein
MPRHPQQLVARLRRLPGGRHVDSFVPQVRGKSRCLRAGQQVQPDQQVRRPLRLRVP